MAKPLSNRSVFITGGGSGIGLACAKRFAEDGAVVALFGRSQDRLEQGMRALQTAVPDAKVLCCAGDVADEDSVASAVEQANTAAPLQIVIANAGTGGFAPITHTDTAQFDAIMQTNLRGSFLTFKQGGQRVAANGGGAMCAISSIAGLRTHRNMGPYCVSKAGIDMLVRNTADELGAQQVRVNSVCPGLVATDLADALLTTEAVHADYLECMPLGRHGQVDDIAASVHFLCSAEASWITGTTLPVDGGHHLRRGPNLDTFLGP